MSQTRRLAAILAADVAGYSRLMGADEEGTLERLKALRRDLLDPKIAEHHGRIVKTTGDGLLVEFASVVEREGAIDRSSFHLFALGVPAITKSHPPRSTISEGYSAIDHGESRAGTIGQVQPLQKECEPACAEIEWARLGGCFGDGAG